MALRQSPFEKLLDSEAKAELLALFHSQPGISDTLEGLAKRIGSKPEETRKHIEEFVRIGLLKEERLYRHNQERDAEIQRTLISQLLGQQTLDLTRPAKQSKTGIELIDQLIVDPTPWDISILLLGDPEAGRSTLCQQLALETLRRGNPVCYFTIDDFPRRIRSSMSNMGEDIEEMESEGRLIFIDCHSPQISAETDARYSEDPRNLTALNIITSKVLTEARPALVVLDSLTGLIQQAGLKNSLGFLRSFNSKIIANGSRSVISLNRKAFHPIVLAGITDIADLAVEMEAEESREPLQPGIHLHLRLLKVAGSRFSTDWEEYIIDPRRGLIKKDKAVEESLLDRIPHIQEAGEREARRRSPSDKSEYPHP
jgi:archaellum biogenesis ATPase FlaH